MELTIDQALQQGVEAHKEGKLQDAERLYRVILQAQPNHPDANHNLGLLAVAVGKPLEAIPLFKQAVKANPQIEQFWLSYVGALVKLERFDEAERVLAEGKKSGVSRDKLDALNQRLQIGALKRSKMTAKDLSLAEKRKAQGGANVEAPSQAQIHLLAEQYQAGRWGEAEALATTLTQQFPEHSFGWKVLGAVFKQTGRLGASLTPMQSAVQLSPLDAEAHSNLGNTLRELGKLNDAEASLRQAIKLKPYYAEAHSNLGVTLREKGSLDGAEASYRKAIALKPDFAEALSNLGATLKEQGRLAEAEASLRQAIKLQPDYAEAHCNLGVTLRERGRLDDAQTSYRRAIELKPDFADAHNNLAAVLRELNRLDEAEKSFRQAAAFTPADAKVHSNLGVILKQRGELDEAQASFRQAASLDPANAAAHSNLGVTLQELGRLDEAEESLRQAISLESNYAEAHSNLGNTLKEQGRLREAEASYRKALALKPDFAEAHNNLGNTLRAQGRLDEAEAGYRKAVALKPDFAEAFSNLGNTLKEKGQLSDAISAYVCAINLTADNAYFYANLGAALKGVRFNQSDRSLYPTLINLLTDGNFARPSSVAGAISSLIKRDALIQDLLPEAKSLSDIRDVGRAIKALSQCSLLEQIMRICPLPDLQLEDMFVSIRRVLLVNLGSTHGSPEFINFFSTLALHCFTNEYVYCETAEETRRISVLEEAIAVSIEQASQPTILEALCLACYRSLHKYKWSKKLQVLDKLPEVRARLIDEPRTERALAQDIPIFATVDDAVSRKVREQYEENPYPRWVKLAIPQKARSVAKVCSKLKLQLDSDNIKNVCSPSILIAGCGTGQHSIETAALFDSSQVTAVDLSLASLAYAQRKTKELGITNIEYFQGDILKLDQQAQKFDVIESGGVLHHMDDPMAGWHVLTKLLNPGGLMKIGLYSELARRDVARLRREIASKGIGASEFELREFRKSLVESHEKHGQVLTRSQDFFSLSAFRDLVFHVQEHCFTLPQIQTCLDELGLKFCGFENQDIVAKFKKLFGAESDAYDLSLWHRFEESYPQTFGQMYQFWCQKL